VQAAGKEFSLERALDKMQADWWVTVTPAAAAGGGTAPVLQQAAVMDLQWTHRDDVRAGRRAGVSFQHMPWRTTGTSILKGLDDIQQLLDDQAVKIQARSQILDLGSRVHASSF
jgi:hypothetical protein